jgi:hypothetical protein
MARSDLRRTLESGLGIPAGAGSETVRDQAVEALLAQLRHRLLEMERAARSIGTVPQGYPLHVRVVIRAIAALLPWYTRPLRHFAQISADTCALMASGLTRCFDSTKSPLSSGKGHS